MTVDYNKKIGLGLGIVHLKVLLIDVLKLKKVEKTEFLERVKERFDSLLPNLINGKEIKYFENKLLENQHFSFNPKGGKTYKKKYKTINNKNKKSFYKNKRTFRKRFFRIRR